jgi:hypothetical protein
MDSTSNPSTAIERDEGVAPENNTVASSQESDGGSYLTQVNATQTEYDDDDTVPETQSVTDEVAASAAVAANANGDESDNDSNGTADTEIYQGDDGDFWKLSHDKDKNKNEDEDKFPAEVRKTELKDEDRAKAPKRDREIDGIGEPIKRVCTGNEGRTLATSQAAVDIVNA